ncbi:MAG: hypothetical protein E7104_02495 [Prevotella sp.]|nr:hypothetical protein [Prevotella sp.]
MMDELFKNIQVAGPLADGRALKDIATAMSAEKVSRIDQENKELLSQIIESNRQEREMKEDNHKALGRIADNSDTTVTALLDANSSLKQLNELLQERNSTMQQAIMDMHVMLGQIINSMNENANAQKQLLQDANALACQMAVSLESGEKIDWKNKFVDGATQSLLLAFDYFIKMKTGM